MDAAQMRNLMEHYRNLKGRVEGCKKKIQRIRSWTFEEYIDAKTHRSTLGESRLNSGKPTNPTEVLGIYGRKQFEQERDYELRSEQRRLAVKQALLWQLNSLIDRLDEKEREITVRRYVNGERNEPN